MKQLKFLLLILFILCVWDAQAQFYNGHQMEFGKNRVQYKDFYWQYFRFSRYDTYYHIGAKELAIYTSKYVEKELPKIESFFEYTLDQRIIFIIYKKHADFKQSNIGLTTNKEQANIGGVTKIIDNKVFVYFEGDHKKFEEQITASLTKILFNQMMYGGNIRDKLANSTLLTVPEWFEKGLISYASKPWSIEIENRVKDGILSERFEKFNRLRGKDAIYAGHSIWNFIAEKYGEAVIPNIVYMTRINKNVESGFMFVLGIPIKDLAKEWTRYYKQKYQNNDNRQLPQTKKIVKKPKKHTVYQQTKISPDGKYIAFISNQMGKYKIWLYNTDTGKKKKILSRGHKLEQITDYSYPVLSWGPMSEKLAILTEYKGLIQVTYYNVNEKRFEKRFFKGNKTSNIFNYDKILDFSFSHNGRKWAVSAQQKGQVDIFVHDIIANASEQITNDLADDFNPRFVNRSEKIIFSSNRTSDSITFDENPNEKVALTQDLFVYNYKNKSPKLTRLTNTPYVNETHPLELKSNRYAYLSDKNGIINRWQVNYDSTIAYVDTITHYRYFTTHKPITNYSRNILEYDVNSRFGISTEIVYANGKYNIFFDEFDAGKKTFLSDLDKTKYRKKLTRQLSRKDSLQQLEEKRKMKQKQRLDSLKALKEQEKENQQLQEDTSTVIVNINNYVFDNEIKQDFSLKNKQAGYLNTENADTFLIPKPRIYQTAFYNNYVVNQIDFSFLNNSYQAYTGGQVYFNPGFTMLFKLGAIDLFENYRITGGVRFSGNFESNEYLLSIENLHDRLDKQYILHRQAFENQVYSNYIEKIHSHQLMYSLKYPFSQVAALKGTLSMRHDKGTFKSLDFASLQNMQIGEYDFSNSLRIWNGIKLEYIFDNTRSLGVNIYDGFRMKIFGEFYKQINDNYYDLWVIGADLRHYLKIHRNLIWANRFAASSSLGNARLIYYLGSVDNWLNFSDVPTFNKDIPIDNQANYVYQTVATNMRGFSQNIRNGSNFALVNTEIRWPVIRYLINRPINSDFLNTFQIVGFADYGSAWTGLSPFSGENAWDTETIENEPITVIIDKHRSPFVGGVGFGLRARVFGYFIRTDWAWGIENNTILPRVFYLSLNLDF